MKRLLLPLISLALAACAAAPAQKDVTVASAADKDGTICERETLPGSNFSKNVCRTAEQRKADREAVNRQGEERRNITGIMTGK